MLVDPRDGLPFYVGKGFHSRMYHHIQEAHLPISKQDNPFKCNIIRSIEKAGMKIKYDCTFMKSSDAALKEEIRLIKKYGRRNNGTGILTNLTDGGDFGNPVQNPISQYTKEGVFVATYPSVAEAARQLNVHEDKLRRCLKGKDRLKSLGGWIYAFEGNDPPKYFHAQKKQVQKYKNGKPIKLYSSAGEAAREIKANPAQVREACKTGYKVKGFVFKYLET
jgi:hypothetical protein